jgi:hypothetical protein
MAARPSTPLDLELVLEELHNAAGLIGVRTAPIVRSETADTYRELRDAERERRVRAGRAWSVVLELAEEADRLLARTAEREREAREAQELAVRALRHLGGASASWERIGELVGMTQQGAHRRFAESAARGRAQMSLADVAGG